MTTSDFVGLKGLISSLLCSQDLQRVTQEKLEIQNQLASLNLEFENMKTSSDQLGQEKWELTQVNNDLQQRLQQTVALARMQVISTRQEYLSAFTSLLSSSNSTPTPNSISTPTQLHLIFKSIQFLQELSWSYTL